MSFPSLMLQTRRNSDIMNRFNATNREILIFRTILAKLSILAYISLNIGYFELGHDYDIAVTSYLELIW